MERQRTNKPCNLRLVKGSNMNFRTQSCSPASSSSFKVDGSFSTTCSFVHGNGVSPMRVTVSANDKNNNNTSQDDEEFEEEEEDQKFDENNSQKNNDNTGIPESDQGPFVLFSVPTTPNNKEPHCSTRSHISRGNHEDNRKNKTGKSLLSSTLNASDLPPCSHYQSPQPQPLDLQCHYYRPTTCHCGNKREEEESAVVATSSKLGGSKTIDDADDGMMNYYHHLTAINMPSALLRDVSFSDSHFYASPGSPIDYGMISNLSLDYEEAFHELLVGTTQSNSTSCHHDPGDELSNLVDPIQVMRETKLRAFQERSRQAALERERWYGKCFSPC